LYIYELIPKITRMTKKRYIYLGALLLMTFWTQKSFGQCYELVWAEEFNYTGFPDPALWNMEVGNNNGANNESQYYTRNDTDNCWIENGLLTITARKENLGGQAYTSARINTKGKAEFMYGKIEGRLRLPYSQGIWPAFWTLGGNIDQVSWPQCGEIDIMELIGGKDPHDRVTYGTPHWADANGNHAMYGGSDTLASGKFNDDFHIFSIEWTPLEIKWFLDRVQFHVMSITPASLSEFHHNHFIILNLAVGGDWPGYPDGTTVLPQKFEIDYVRVYQNLKAQNIEGKDSVLANEKDLTFSVAAVEGRSYEWIIPEGANLLTQTDSNAVVVDWGCTAGEIICNVSTTCSTEYILKKNIGIVQPEIEGLLFYDQSEGNIFFSIPALLETDYLWTIPEGGSFISNDTSNIAEVAWGSEPGTVTLNITNTCGESSISKKILKYGQYPYPDPESPFLIPGTINATDYDYGGEGVAYHDADVANQGTGPREDERVDTENQLLFPNVGWITTGEWLEYTIKVPESGYYRIELKTASQNTINIGPLRILINGESRINDISVPSTGAWTKFVTVSERLLYLNTTDTILRIEAVKGGFNLGPITILVDNTVSFRDISSGSGRPEIYPNPVTDELNIVFHLLKPGDVKINMLDVSGKHLFASDFKGLGSGEQRISVSENIRSLNSGLYFIELNIDTQKYFSKFLKD
jgi:beta-glucanase (GH16 family)